MWSPEPTLTNGAKPKSHTSRKLILIIMRPDLIELSSPGRDQFGRKYPIKIQLKDGSVVYGHFKCHETQGDPAFFLIEDIDAWKNNAIRKGNKVVVIKFNDIEAAENFKDY